MHRFDRADRGVRRAAGADLRLSPAIVVHLEPAGAVPRQLTERQAGVDVHLVAQLEREPMPRSSSATPCERGLTI